MTALKGLMVSVYRDADPTFPDCTAGGVSSRCTKLVVVGTKRWTDKTWQPLDRYSQVFEANDERPAMILVESNVPGLYGPHLVPLEYVEKGTNTKEYAGPMAGGNFAATSDSRWSELGAHFGHDHLDAVPIHDRVESWATNYALTAGD